MRHTTLSEIIPSRPMPPLDGKGDTTRCV